MAASHRDLPAIIIDTREQLPYAFTGYTTKRATLSTGDYSIEGYEHRIAIERKSKEDAWGCVGEGRRRFTACLERLSALERACVVIECSLAQFAERPIYVEQVDSRQAVGSYVSWSCSYRLPVFWCDQITRIDTDENGNKTEIIVATARQVAERVVIRFLAAYLKHVANGRDYQPSPATRAHPSALGL